MTEKVTGEPERLNPEYRTLLKEMLTDLREQGEAAIEKECHAFKLARMLTLAPESYYTLLEASNPGASKELRAWAANQIECHDDAEFFALLTRVGDIRRAEGDDALAGPEHACLIVRMMRTAPPRYRAPRLMPLWSSQGLSRGPRTSTNTASRCSVCSRSPKSSARPSRRSNLL